MSTSVVKCCEGLRNRVPNIIRKYIGGLYEFVLLCKFCVFNVCLYILIVLYVLFCLFVFIVPTGTLRLNKVRFFCA